MNTCIFAWLEGNVSTFILYLQYTLVKQPPDKRSLYFTSSMDILLHFKGNVLNFVVVIKFSEFRGRFPSRLRKSAFQFASVVI